MKIQDYRERKKEDEARAAYLHNNSYNLPRELHLVILAEISQAVSGLPHKRHSPAFTSLIVCIVS
jgi:hypothetical protein